MTTQKMIYFSLYVTKISVSRSVVVLVHKIMVMGVLFFCVSAISI